MRVPRPGPRPRGDGAQRIRVQLPLLRVRTRQRTTGLGRVCRVRTVHCALCIVHSSLTLVLLTTAHR